MNCCAEGGYGGTGDEGCGNVKEDGCVKGVGGKADSGEDRGDRELHGREQKSVLVLFTFYKGRTSNVATMFVMSPYMSGKYPPSMSYIDKDQIKVHIIFRMYPNLQLGEGEQGEMIPVDSSREKVG